MAIQSRSFPAGFLAALLIPFGFGLLFPAIPAAGAFPEKPVKILQGSAPGGTTDLMTRMLASLVTETLGQPFIVVVKAGASGTVAANEVAQSRPDGYTLLSTPILALAVAPFQIKVKYDSLKDFDPLVTYAGGVYGICVLPDSPWKTFRELIEYARANPGELSVSTPGVGSTEHLTFEQVARKEKISWKHVPYPGGAPAAAALLGGHVKVNFGSGSHLPFVEAGKFRVLALNALNRNPKTPDIPTLRDLGYDIPVPNSFMMASPKGLPEDISKIHEDAFLKAARSDVFKEFLKKLMQDHDVRDRAASRKTLETEYRTWGGIIERLGIKPK